MRLAPRYPATWYAMCATPPSSVTGLLQFDTSRELLEHAATIAELIAADRAAYHWPRLNLDGKADEAGLWLNDRRE